MSTPGHAWFYCHVCWTRWVPTLLWFPSSTPSSLSPLYFSSSSFRLRAQSRFLLLYIFSLMQHPFVHGVIPTKLFPLTISHLDTLITLVHKWLRHTKCTWSGCQLTIFFKLLFFICKFVHFRSHIKAREYSRKF